MEGSEVIVKFGSRRYRATIIDLLEWQPPERRRKSKDTRASEQPPRSSAKKNDASKGSAKKTKASKSSAAKSSITSKRSAKAIKPLWLGSGSSAKSSTELQVEEEALRRAETRAVLGEITNIPQHHNAESHADACGTSSRYGSPDVHLESILGLGIQNPFPSNLDPHGLGMACQLNRTLI